MNFCYFVLNWHGAKNVAIKRHQKIIIPFHFLILDRVVSPFLVQNPHTTI